MLSSDFEHWRHCFIFPGGLLISAAFPVAETVSADNRK